MTRMDHVENFAILATICVCTASVAYFARSGAGLWSLLLIMIWKWADE